MKFNLNAFRSKGVTRLFGGQLISQVCDKMMTTGLIWFFTQNGSGHLITWYLCVGGLPHLILAGRSGRWIERWGEGRVLVAADLVRGIIGLALSLVLSNSTHAWTTEETWGLFFIYALLSNFAGALFNPAIYSISSRMTNLENLPQLTALLSSCFTIGGLVGPLLTALIFPSKLMIYGIAVGGVKGLFMWNGISYLIAALMEFNLPLKDRVRSNAETTHDSGSGSSFDWLLPELRTTLLGFLFCNLFFAPLNLFLPLFASEIFHGDIDLLVKFEILISAGVASGTAFLTFWSWKESFRVQIQRTMFFVSIAFLGFVFSRNLPLSLSSLFFLGFSIALVDVVSLSLYQAVTPPNKISTLMSFVNLISVAATPVSMLAVAIAQKYANIQSIAAICAFGIVASASFLMFNRSVHRLDQSLSMPGENKND